MTPHNYPASLCVSFLICKVEAACEALDSVSRKQFSLHSVTIVYDPHYFRKWGGVLLQRLAWPTATPVAFPLINPQAMAVDVTAVHVTTDLYAHFLRNTSSDFPQRPSQVRDCLRLTLGRRMLSKRTSWGSAVPVEELSSVLQVGEVGQGGFWAPQPMSSRDLRSHRGGVHCWPGAAPPPGFQGSSTQGGVVVARGWEGPGAD